MISTTKKIFVAVVLLAVFALIALGVFFVRTPQGSQALIRWAINTYEWDRQVDVSSLNGDFWHGLTMTGIELNEVVGLPPGSRVKIHSLSVALTALTLDGLTVEIENGRVVLPDSDDPILFFGRLAAGRIEAEVFTRDLRAREIWMFFPAVSYQVKNITGALEDIDLKVTGPWSEPQIRGTLLVREVSYSGIALREAPVELQVTVPDLLRSPDKILGRFLFRSGQIASRATLVTLQESLVHLQEELDNPDLNIKGDSQIGKTKIKIAVKGRLKDPQVSLTSNPALPKAQLMVMLATGHSWKGMTSSFEQGTLSPQLLSDFVDYFFFAGQGGKMAEAFGIKDVSVRMEEGRRGVGLKKTLTDRVDLLYDVEQAGTDSQALQVKQRIGGEVEVVQGLSLRAEKEIRPPPEEAEDGRQPLEDPAPGEQKIYFKYETAF